ncbi:hypothetical protein H4S00_000566 [Coemansia sp. D1744]|nr:hypothetical protein H4S00_000566 [Coemansia sp. D1744]
MSYTNSSLPPNFISLRDQNGREYFVDRNTGRSQWEDPRKNGYAGPPQNMQNSYGNQYQQQQQQGGYYQGPPQGYNNQGPPQGYNNQGYNNQGYNNQGYNNQGPPQGYYQGPPQGYQQQWSGQPPNGYQQGPPPNYYQQSMPPQAQQHVVAVSGAPKKESFFKKHSLLTGLAAGGLAAYGVNEFMEHEQEERYEAYEEGRQDGFADGYEDGFDDGGDF